MRMPQTVGTSHDTKYRFYGKLERVLERFPKYNTQILLGELMQRLQEKKFSNWQFGKRD
jgi:hypothetical protein